MPRKLKKYPHEVEDQMRKCYQLLSEKDRRRYLGVEAIKLGYGGKGYLCKLFGCDYKTIAKGIQEIQDQTESRSKTKSVRRKGGGRKRTIEKAKGLTKTFFEAIEGHVAGSPMDEKIKWTNLSQREIKSRLAKKGFRVSLTVVQQLLAENNFRRRKAFKTKAGREYDHRDEQFQKIDWLKDSYNQTGDPVLSMDVKKKNR